LAYFRSSPDDNLFVGFFQVLWELLRLERLAFWYDGGTQHLRFCDDTPLSGRSFLPAVFALGLYEYSWYYSQHRFAVNSERLLLLRACLAAGFCLVVSCQVGFLVNYCENSSAIVVISLAVALLLYTNPTITVATNQWVVSTMDLGGAVEVSDLLTQIEDQDDSNAGTILVPPCCLPLCLFQGRYVLHGFESYEEQLQQLSKRVADRQELVKHHEHRSRESELLLDSVRADLEHMNRLRQADQEHLTSMCLEERKKRVEMEQTLESARREAERRGARQAAEAQKRATSEKLLSMPEIVEQPRWSSPMREALSRAPKSAPVKANQEAWV